MTTKKSDDKSAEPAEEYPMGVARPAADDPTVHVEEWPEAYDNPLVEGGETVAPESASTKDSKGS